VAIIYNNTKHKYLSLVLLLHRNKYAETPGINQPKKEITMVEPFARSSGKAIANQLTPPLGVYAGGADQGRCSRVLYNCSDRLRKKLISELSNFILVFMPSQLNCPQNN
jgi:hypothetical protein